MTIGDVPFSLAALAKETCLKLVFRIWKWFGVAKADDEMAAIMPPMMIRFLMFILFLKMSFALGLSAWRRFLPFHFKRQAKGGYFQADGGPRSGLTAPRCKEIVGGIAKRKLGSRCLKISPNGIGTGRAICEAPLVKMAPKGRWGLDALEESAQGQDCPAIPAEWPNRLSPFDSETLGLQAIWQVAALPTRCRQQGIWQVATQGAFLTILGLAKIGHCGCGGQKTGVRMPAIPKTWQIVSKKATKTELACTCPLYTRFFMQKFFG